MNWSLFIMSLVLLLTLIAPFGVFYAIQLARKQQYLKHRRIQILIFIICFIGLLALEGLIRFSGGSGSLASKSLYYETSFFKLTLYSHIFIAVITYLLWIFLSFFSNKKYPRQLPGNFSNMHKILGYIIFYGLIYTAITALAIYLMTLNLV